MKVVWLLFVLLLIGCSDEEEVGSGITAVFKPFETESANIFSVGDIDNPYFIRISGLATPLVYSFEVNFSQNDTIIHTITGDIPSNDGSFYIRNNLIFSKFFDLVYDDRLDIDIIITNISDGVKTELNESLLVKNGGEIFTWLDLKNISYDMTASYIVMNDIALPTDYPVAITIKPIMGLDGSPFTGSISSGGAKQSRNIDIQSIVCECDNVGLFAKLGDGFSISDLAINYRTDTGLVGKNNVGGLAGSSNAPNGAVENVQITGKIVGIDSVGGVIGLLSSSSQIGGAYGRINFSGMIEATGSSGGIIGRVDRDNGNLAITRSFVENIIITGSNVGGLVGEITNSGTILFRNSYVRTENTSNFNATQNLGGLIGKVGNVSNYLRLCQSYTANKNLTAPITGNIIGSIHTPRMIFADDYYDYQLNSYEAAGYIEGTGTSGALFGINSETTANMKKASTYVGWDFLNIWDIISGETYPFLRQNSNLRAVEGC